MQSFPIFLRLQGRPLWSRRQRTSRFREAAHCSAAGARVELVSRSWASLDGYALVFGATGDDAGDRAVSEAARAAGIPVNVVDRPELSDFIMPAVVDRGDSRRSASRPAAARPSWRSASAPRSKNVLPSGLDRLAAFARRFRAAVQTRVTDNATRRRFWERFFEGEGAELVMAGEALSRRPQDYPRSQCSPTQPERSRVAHRDRAHVQQQRRPDPRCAACAAQGET